MLAFTVVSIITPIGILFVLLFRWNKIVSYFATVAYSLDQLGNVTCQWILNLTMIKEGGLCFGNPDRTVSFTIGVNKSMQKLTSFGMFWADFLDKLEPNHVENAVKNEIKEDKT